MNFNLTEQEVNFILNVLAGVSLNLQEGNIRVGIIQKMQVQAQQQTSPKAMDAPEQPPELL